MCSRRTSEANGWRVSKRDVLDVGLSLLDDQTPRGASLGPLTQKVNRRSRMNIDDHAAALGFVEIMSHGYGVNFPL